MLSRKHLFWLAFIASGGIAYPIVFWEQCWPLGRIIAGWYSIFVIVVVVASGIITLSIKWGPFKSHPGVLDIFTF